MISTNNQQASFLGLNLRTPFDQSFEFNIKKQEIMVMKFDHV